MNRVYSDGLQWDGVNPIESLTGIKPHVYSFRKFGCIAFANIPIQFREGKLARQPRKEIMVGYLGGAYRVYFPETGRITITKDVRMMEDTVDRKDESTLDLEEPANNLPLVEVNQPIPHPDSEVVPDVPNQLDALTHFPEIRISTRITQEPYRYEGGKIMVAVETDYADHPG